MVFSALVHDVDHVGVSNGQLAKEQPKLADKYKNQSIAESNSVDLAWDLLMQPCFKELQLCIFADRSEFLRFRQLVVTTVLATDIFDQQLKALRNMRWERAFHPDELNLLDRPDELSSSAMSVSESTDVSNSISTSVRGEVKNTSTNRKATIVIEHVIQASDVAHTMQHWNIYKKWNERLFQEMYLAHKKGRNPKDPSEGWYKGELWFFDNYVLPLARKLEECGVFGVASDECLTNALENRRAWAQSGEDVVKEMVEKAEKIAIKLDVVTEEEEERSESENFVA